MFQLHTERHMRMAVKCTVAVIILLLLAMGSRAQAAQIQDLVRLKGAESNKLVGMGIVVGLNGTGDGGRFAPAMRSLAAVTQRLIDPATIAAELRDAENVALVTLTANIPASGVMEGDKVDVHVSAIAAESLKGGRLFLIPMTGPLPNSPVFAYAEGAITIEDDSHPTVGVIHNGAQLTRNILTQFLNEDGQITLVIKDDIATLPMANNLANLINNYISPDEPTIATAISGKVVVVDVPLQERRKPVPFISSVLQTFVDPSMINTGARVVINEKTGTIVFSHDVQFSPIAVSHAGLSIDMVTPAPQPTAQNPQVDRQHAIAIDPDKRGGAKLADLIKAFNQLKVDAQDRIEIIKEINRAGKLHAQLSIQNE